jgi:hypothetical protein
MLAPTRFTSCWLAVPNHAPAPNGPTLDPADTMNHTPTLRL